MKSRFWGTLTFIAVIVLIAVYVTNAPGTPNPKAFAYQSFYEPIIKTHDENAAEVYQSLVGTKGLACPQPELTRNFSNLVYVDNIYQKNGKDSVYSVGCFFVAYDWLNKGSEPKDRPSEYDEFKSLLKSDSTDSVFELCSTIPESGYVEITAPFNFDFGSTNTTKFNEELTIVNKQGNCKITFYNVANWFCAGPPGTSQVLADGGESSSWEQHTHFTIIGDTANAIVKSGSLGQIIGYAKADTTFKISKLNEGNVWVDISIHDFIMDMKN